MNEILSQERHAYLIMCHCNFTQLMKMLLLLDDESNDIFIHIDKKVNSIPFDAIEGSLSKSKLVFVERTNVNWGGHSQIKAEIELLKKATESHHVYYHLLSGMDLPLKTQEEIHQFFRDNNGKEYISISDNYDELIETRLIERVQYYYPFQNIVGRNNGIQYRFLGKLNSGLVKLQRNLKYDRTSCKNIEFYKGANWFSITHELARFVITKEKQIKSLFKYTHCADELFLQTIAMNSPFASKIANDDLRLIDWNRGNPYVFHKEDYHDLTNSGRLFARKFDERIDNDIIEMLVNYLISKEQHI